MSGPRVLTAITFELLHVAQGHPMRFELDDGTEVELRLPTVDEVLAQQAAASARLAERMAGTGWVPPPPLTRARAAELAAPLRVPR